jgi:cation transport regulator ChaC
MGLVISQLLGQNPLTKGYRDITLGSCRNYLFDTIHGLKGFEIHDRHLDRIARLVREYRD